MRRFRWAVWVVCFHLATGSAAMSANIGPTAPPVSWAWRSDSVGERWHVGLVTLPKLERDTERLVVTNRSESLARFWGCEVTWPVAASPARSIWAELYSDPCCCPEADPREAAFAARKAALVGGRSETDVTPIGLAAAAVEGHVSEVVRDYRHSVGVIEALRLNADNQGTIRRSESAKPVRQPAVANSNWLGLVSQPFERPYEYDYSQRFSHRYAGDSCHDEYCFMPPAPGATTVAATGDGTVVDRNEIVREDLARNDEGEFAAPDSRRAAQVREMLTCTSCFFRCLGEACRSISHQLAETADDIRCEQEAVAASSDKNGDLPDGGPVRSSRVSANYRGL